MLLQILGFFCAGVVLNQFGLIRNLTDVKLLSEWGILFLVRVSFSFRAWLFHRHYFGGNAFTPVIDSPLCLRSVAV
jgi:hypothetical protein